MSANPPDNSTGFLSQFFEATGSVVNKALHFIEPKEIQEGRVKWVNKSLNKLQGVNQLLQAINHPLVKEINFESIYNEFNAIRLKAASLSGEEARTAMQNQFQATYNRLTTVFSAIAETHHLEDVIRYFQDPPHNPNHSFGIEQLIKLFHNSLAFYNNQQVNRLQLLKRKLSETTIHDGLAPLFAELGLKIHEIQSNPKQFYPDDPEFTDKIQWAEQWLGADAADKARNQALLSLQMMPRFYRAFDEAWHDQPHELKHTDRNTIHTLIGEAEQLTAGLTDDTQDIQALEEKKQAIYVKIQALNDLFNQELAACSPDQWAVLFAQNEQRRQTFEALTAAFEQKAARVAQYQVRYRQSEHQSLYNPLVRFELEAEHLIQQARPGIERTQAFCPTHCENIEAFISTAVLLQQACLTLEKTNDALDRIDQQRESQHEKNKSLLVEKNRLLGVYNLTRTRTSPYFPEAMIKDPLLARWNQSLEDYKKTLIEFDARYSAFHNSDLTEDNNAEFKHFLDTEMAEIAQRCDVLITNINHRLKERMPSNANIRKQFLDTQHRVQQSIRRFLAHIPLIRLQDEADPAIQNKLKALREFIDENIYSEMTWPENYCSFLVVEKLPIDLSHSAYIAVKSPRDKLYYYNYPKKTIREIEISSDNLAHLLSLYTSGQRLCPMELEGLTQVTGHQHLTSFHAKNDLSEQLSRHLGYKPLFTFVEAPVDTSESYLTQEMINYYLQTMMPDRDLSHSIHQLAVNKLLDIEAAIETYDLQPLLQEQEKINVKAQAETLTQRLTALKSSTDNEGIHSQIPQLEARLLEAKTSSELVAIGHNITDLEASVQQMQTANEAEKARLTEVIADTTEKLARLTAVYPEPESDGPEPLAQSSDATLTDLQDQAEAIKNRFDAKLARAKESMITGYNQTKTNVESQLNAVFNGKEADKIAPFEPLLTALAEDIAAINDIEDVDNLQAVKNRLDIQLNQRLSCRWYRISNQILALLSEQFITVFNAATPADPLPYLEGLTENKQALKPIDPRLNKLLIMYRDFTLLNRRFLTPENEDPSLSPQAYRDELTNQVSTHLRGRDIHTLSKGVIDWWDKFCRKIIALFTPTEKFHINKLKKNNAFFKRGCDTEQTLIRAGKRFLGDLTDNTQENINNLLEEIDQIGNNTIQQ